MAVQFILGRSGTGKTSFCTKALANALLDRSQTEPLILLVPEQATYQAERAILTDQKIDCYTRLHVLSFDRLRFLLTDKNPDAPVLSPLSQQMIIHRILRQQKDKLKLFTASPSTPGLARQMTETITELCQYAQTPPGYRPAAERIAKRQKPEFIRIKIRRYQPGLQRISKLHPGPIHRPGHPAKPLAAKHRKIAFAKKRPTLGRWLCRFHHR